MCGAWGCVVSAVSEDGVEWGDRESVLWSVRRGDGGGGLGSLWNVVRVWGGWMGRWLDGWVHCWDGGWGGVVGW